MSESVGSEMFVPFEFQCPRHPMEFIKKVDLSVDVSLCNRVLCSQCKVQNSNNQPSLGHFFHFLTNTQAKYKYIAEDFKRIRKLISETKIQILKYLEDQNKQLEMLENVIEQKKILKENELYEYLQREQMYSTQQLANFIQRLSVQVKTEKTQLKFINSFFTDHDKKSMKQIENNLKSLSNWQSNIHKIPKIEEEILPINNLYKKDKQIAIQNAVDIIEFNAEGNILAIATQNTLENSYVQMWSVDGQNLSLLQQLKEHTKNVISLSFSNNNTLATGSIDCSVILWKQIQSQWILQQKIINNQIVSCVRFSHSNQYIAAGSQQLLLFKLQSDEYCNHAILNEHQQKIQCIVFNQNDNLLVSSDLEKIIQVSSYDDETWQIKYILPWANQIPIFIEFYDQNNFFSFSNNNEMIIWMYCEETKEYECKIVTQTQQIKFATYCYPQKLFAICSNDSVQINKFESLMSFKTEFQFNQVCNFVKFSRNGMKFALLSQEVLHIYKKND